MVASRFEAAWSRPAASSGIGAGPSRSRRASRISSQSALLNDPKRYSLGGVSSISWVARLIGQWSDPWSGSVLHHWTVYLQPTGTSIRSMVDWCVFPLLW